MTKVPAISSKLQAAKATLALGLDFIRSGQGETRLTFKDLGVTDSELRALLRDLRAPHVRCARVDNLGTARITLVPGV